MTRSVILAALLSALLPIAACSERSPGNRAVMSLGSDAFEGFIECRTGEQTSGLMDRLFSSSIPLRKEEGYWSFAVTGEVMGLPVKIVDIGVCDAAGNRDCGWGAFIALTVEKPLDEAKRQLQKRYGTDFTEEKRDEEYEITIRPVLVRSKPDGSTVLYCDPGTL